MIKLFRNIRKKLATEGKAIVYMRYAIGEIVLVVIGILIALQVNNWNEARKDLLKRHAYTKSLVRELKQDTTDYNGSIKLINETTDIINGYEKRLELESATVDTLKQIARFEFNPAIIGTNTYNSNTLKALQSSGDVRLYPRSIQELMLELLAEQESMKEIIDMYLNEYQSASEKQNLLTTRPEKHRFFSMNDKLKSKAWNQINEVELIRVFDNLMNVKINYYAARLWLNKAASKRTEELITALENLDKND